MLLSKREGRVALTKHDPLLFAYIYLRHHITNPADGSVTVAQFHLDLVEYSKTWTGALGKPKEFRDAFIAPRQSGKTTWLFLILPMWAAAHGHKSYIAAFADSSTQAEGHLLTFKQELQVNEALRADFPDLCEPKRGQSMVGRYLLWNRSEIAMQNGFSFMVRGADTASLGMKMGEKRPEVLLFDDIEGGESNYSALEARKRLETLTADLFALNYWARVCIIGTTTMPNSIIDQIRKVGEVQAKYGDDRDQLDPDLRWVLDQNVNVHYYPAILNEGEDEQSFWPEVWTMDSLNEMRHTRDFAKNMMNRPVSLDGGYWADDDIVVDQGDYTRTIVSVDPAVTTAKASDYTGLAVVSKGADGRVYVRHASQVKLASEALLEAVSDLCTKFDAKVVYVESNQGGDLWKQVFSGVPAKLRTMRNTEKKEIRAGQAFDFYKKDKVRHAASFPMLEEQMYNFPKVKNDDILDAVVSGVLYFLRKKQGGSVSAAQINYIGDN